MQKAERVRSFFKKNEDTVIMLSGGVDSSVLALLASEGSNRKVPALTFRSLLTSDDEIGRARTVARQLGLDHHVLEIDMIYENGVRANGAQRCYWCRKKLDVEALAWARMNRYGLVADGLQADEATERRPGLRAALEDGIVHPLAEAGLSKEEIREIARSALLPNADRPAAPCLATRFPPGVPLSTSWIDILKKAEAAVAGMGFVDFRVRFFPPGLAVLEVDLPQQERAWAMREELSAALREAGFPVAALDLEGLERGKMDRFLEVEDHDCH